MPNGIPSSDGTTGRAHPVRVPAVTRSPVRVPAEAPRLRAVGPEDCAPERTLWSRRLSGLLTDEIAEAAAAGVVTDAEADQLLARLVLVIDQALGSFP